MDKKTLLRLGGIAFLVIVFGPLFYHADTPRAPIVPPSSRAPVVPPSSAPKLGKCETDWKLCKDNTDLIKNYNRHEVQVQCKIAAESRWMYGTPSVYFRSWADGDDYITNGKAFMVANDGEFQNKYGTTMRSRVACTYDLETRKVTYLKVMDIED